MRYIYTYIYIHIRLQKIIVLAASIAGYRMDAWFESDMYILHRMYIYISTRIDTEMLGCLYENPTVCYGLG